SQPLVLLRNVVHWDTNIETEVELRLGFVRCSFALHFADGAIEHLRVEFESDGFNVPALFSAQQITCAAQFQVKRRDFETRAEIGKFFQRCQASAGDRSKL